MKTDDTRDQAVERLLRRSLEIGSQAGVSPDCLDAETFAAWTDGTLRGAALAAVEAHVAGCPRCQSMAAVMMRTVPAAPVAMPWWPRHLSAPESFTLKQMFRRRWKMSRPAERGKTTLPPAKLSRRAWLGGARRGFAGRLRSAWLVPITAAAAAVAIWSVVPDRASTPSQPDASVSVPAKQGVPEAKAPSQPALADRLEARAGKDTAGGKRQTADETRQTAEGRRQTAGKAARNERPDARQSDAAAAADTFADARPVPLPPASAGAPPAAPGRPAAEAEPPARAREAVGALLKQEAFVREVVSPDPAIRWRLGAAGAIDRTEDGGATWTRLTTGATGELVAGASPSSSVCWVVGRNGTVLRSTDGRTWARVNIPEAADLVSVEAPDASTAFVTTADGRRFRTSDGGQTWVR